MTSSILINFIWQGVDRAGNKIKGELTAASLDEVKQLLRHQGISVQKVQKKTSCLLCQQKEKLNTNDICVLTRQIATMLKAGVSVIQTIDMLAQGHSKQHGRDVLMHIANDIKAGNQVSAALRKHPELFTDLYCDLVSTGEQTGALENIFERLAVYAEKAEALKAKIKKALYYPSAVLVIALIITSILLIFVVPQFKMIFSNFGAELPVVTQMVLSLSNFMQKFGMFILGGSIITSWILVATFKSSIKFRDKVDRYTLTLPVVGEILQKAAIARFTRTLATTFAAGVPLMISLDEAANASSNIVYRTATQFIRSEVAGGNQVFTAMRGTGVFPEMVVQMIAIGEEAGSMDDMLTKVADIYERQVDDLVDNLTRLLEPFIMAVLGLVMGSLIMAMYLPIFQMGNVV
jgi:type IV pilus assembly protein PilC